MWGDGAVIDIGGGVVDCGDDEIVGLGDVLKAHVSGMVDTRSVEGSAITRPPFFSTHIAFFFWSIQRVPAMTEVIVEGGTWRRPGPSLSGRDGLEGMGKTSAEMVSPGSTTVWAAIWPKLP